ncbi:NACHT, LRR and PYD domains-containing protein 12-like [Hemitrygon akajei]|uniref:NACHT, LRR and PYD domains-containing protein 12-like n=1 Tax=Hemitrygon akajei TaxID=2704970 RepID=UPI003BF99371
MVAHCLLKIVMPRFVFSFKFRDLKTINCRINLRELILDQYPYFGNILREVWKNPEGLLFIFDGLDEFKHRIDFADSRRDTEPKHQCPDPEWRCEVSDIVYSLIQGKLLPGCSVLVTTRPTVLHLLENAKIGVWAEILGFVGEERKEYFIRHFEDQTVAAAVFKHVQENEILCTMSYNPSYCCILAQELGPFFTHGDRDPQRIPKTMTELYSNYIYSILKNHGREIEKPRDVLRRDVGLTDSGAKDLASALSTNPSLTELDLCNNKLGDSGVKLVFSALGNTELNRVGLTDSGAENLASALSTNPTLTELDLNYNKLGDSGVKLVSAALRNPECKICTLRKVASGLLYKMSSGKYAGRECESSVWGLPCNRAERFASENEHSPQSLETASYDKPSNPGIVFMDLI